MNFAIQNFYLQHFFTNTFICRFFIIIYNVRKVLVNPFFNWFGCLLFILWRAHSKVFLCFFFSIFLLEMGFIDIDGNMREIFGAKVIWFDGFLFLFIKFRRFLILQLIETIVFVLNKILWFDHWGILNVTIDSTLFEFHAPSKF